MNELVTRNETLPDTLPELSKFVLVGREKLNAVRAEIRAIEKVGLAKEVLEQKKLEAQEIAELVTLSEVRIGKMLKSIPKKSGGDRRSEDFKNIPRNNFETKSSAACELGFSSVQVSQFQRMAEHEDIVHEAMKEAREKDDIVSRSAVMRAIAASAPPHKKENPLMDARKRHAEFSRKDKDVVPVSEIKQDGKDRKAIEAALIDDIYDIISNVNSLAVFNSQKTLKDACRNLDSKSRARLIEGLKRCISELSVIVQRIMLEGK